MPIKVQKVQELVIPKHYIGDQSFFVYWFKNEHYSWGLPLSIYFICLVYAIEIQITGQGLCVILQSIRHLSLMVKALLTNPIDQMSFRLAWHIVIRGYTKPLTCNHLLNQTDQILNHSRIFRYSMLLQYISATPSYNFVKMCAVWSGATLDVTVRSICVNTTCKTSKDILIVVQTILILLSGSTIGVKYETLYNCFVGDISNGFTIYCFVGDFVCRRFIHKPSVLPMGHGSFTPGLFRPKFPRLIWPEAE